MTRRAPDLSATVRIPDPRGVMPRGYSRGAHPTLLLMVVTMETEQ